MNARERFYRTMHFKPLDRVPFWDWFWAETVERWHKEGLPQNVSVHELFDFDKTGVVQVDLGMLPRFERQIIEETEKHRIVIDESGVKKKGF